MEPMHSNNEDAIRISSARTPDGFFASIRLPDFTRPYRIIIASTAVVAASHRHRGRPMPSVSNETYAILVQTPNSSHTTAMKPVRINVRPIPAMNSPETTATTRRRIRTRHRSHAASIGPNIAAIAIMLATLNEKRSVGSVAHSIGRINVPDPSSAGVIPIIPGINAANQRVTTTPTPSWKHCLNLNRINPPRAAASAPAMEAYQPISHSSSSAINTPKDMYVNEAWADQKPSTPIMPQAMTMLHHKPAIPWAMQSNSR